MSSSNEAERRNLFVGQDSHVGYERLVNEDDFGWFSTPNGELLVIADGLSGQAGGGVASRLAVSAFKEVMNIGSNEPAGLLLKKAVLAADDSIAEAGENYPELRGLGSSLVALLVRGAEVWYIHVGDSRLYLSTPQGLNLLTRDHSFKQQELDAGRISAREAAEDMEEQFLVQTLGTEVNAGALHVGHRDCRTDDIFLLCTSGLPALVRDQEMQRVLQQSFTPQVKARKLIEVALQTGGADNITVQVASFKPGKEDGRSPATGRAKSGRGFIVGLVCGLVLGVGGWYAWNKWGRLAWEALFSGQ